MGAIERWLRGMFRLVIESGYRRAYNRAYL
jgi:hypothetical protein